MLRVLFFSFLSFSVKCKLVLALIKLPLALARNVGSKVLRHPLPLGHHLRRFWRPPFFHWQNYDWSKELLATHGPVQLAGIPRWPVGTKSCFHKMI